MHAFDAPGRTNPFMPMLVLHANWMDGALRVWGESLDRFIALTSADAIASRSVGRSATATAVATAAAEHPFTVSVGALGDALSNLHLLAASADFAPTNLRLRLPRDAWGPWPSDRLAALSGAVDLPVDPWLDEFAIQAVTLPNDQALATLLRLDEHGPDSAIDLSHDLRFWISVAKFVAELLADQRFIPTLMQGRGNGLTGAWQPWLHDEDIRKRVAALLRAMPPIVRATVNGAEARPWPILDEAMRTLTDVTVRTALSAERFIEAIDGRDPATDSHVAWLAGLLDQENAVCAPAESGVFLLRDAGLWVGRLDDTGQDRPFHLCLRLNEPSGAEKREPVWPLTLHLQAADDPEQIIDAAQLWGPTPVGGVGGRIDHPQELLLAELGRASRIYPRLETALAETHPSSIELSTTEAYEFLHEFRPLLEESGVSVIVPAWWNQPMGRLGARLHVESPTLDAPAVDGNGTAPSAAGLLGLNSLVNYRWQIAIGDQPLTQAEFESLARQVAPLVQVRGKWIEITPSQLAEARQFLEKKPSGQMTLLEAIQIAHGVESKLTGLPIHGMDAHGWVADVLGASNDSQRMPQLDQPPDFHGTLRPYQKTGLSWLSFLDQFGLGACLADDMGLGKTIQLIAMLLHERQGGNKGQESVGPTLLVVPTSVIVNWVRELERFAPSLKSHVQHGSDRPVGDNFVEIANRHDVVITTYPLISRDHETLRRVKWHRVALDEAQYIKNPPTKQTTAIRSLQATRRLALTGTPVENRLSELWSIMEFCNPGYLGPAGEFRRRFGVPIERHRDQRQAERLRQMVRPFVLRRVKTDPKVISDLPACLETKEYATLSPEQAALYQQTVNAMLGEVEQAQGMQRRGLVLATLVKLKQLCNHPNTGIKNPASAAREDDLSNDDSPPVRNGPLSPETWHLTPGAPSLSSRSGKSKRLMAMLEEVLAAGDKALIFTQFRQMGHLLTAMIRADLDCEALFLHGGTPAAKRQGLIDRFQSPEGGAPIFVLSLKAGGLGLNLTAANHVFHYDRWWNPAVENQATDRAFRIGQTRTVHVHKFVCQGTLEERIDQMIEQKVELAQNIIGAGEQWLTELSTGQLRDLLVLRPSAMEAES